MRDSARTRLAAVPACDAACGALGGSTPTDVPREDAPPRDDAGCAPRACLAECLVAGASGGACVADGVCRCAGGPDGDRDSPAAASRCIHDVVGSTGTEITGLDLCSEPCDVLADTVCPAMEETCRPGWACAFRPEGRRLASPREVVMSVIRGIPWAWCWWGIAAAWPAGCGSMGDDADRPDVADRGEGAETSDDANTADGGDGADDRPGDAWSDGAMPEGADALPDVPEDEPDGPGDGGGEADGAARTGCLADDGLSPYWGNFHAHTSFSDGEREPSDAFAYARDVAGLDVLIVTDHLEQIYLPTRWADCKEQADEADAPGAFVADCGYEYGSGFDAFFRSTGHNNVFNNPDLFPVVQLDFHDFYASLVACPSCIGQFNHPGDEPLQHWNHFEYDAAVDERMLLYEFNSSPAWEMYFEALDAGWHVSPMWNQDNHSANWGTANDHRSGLWLAALTRDGVYEAFRARRTFATADRNAWVRVLADGDCWMGSDLVAVGPSVELSVEAEDEDAADVFDTVELWGPGRTLVGAADCGAAASCAVSFEVAVVEPTYVVVRVNQVDGEWLAAAPVWLAP